MEVSSYQHSVTREALGSVKLSPPPPPRKMIAPNSENICVSGKSRSRRSIMGETVAALRQCVHDRAKLHRGKVRTKV